MWIDSLLERNALPDGLIRLGIRQLLKKTLQEKTAKTAEARQTAILAFVNQLKTMPIAIETSAANEQHYEVPAAFYDPILGHHKKYSCGYWDDRHAPETMANLDAAQARMLDLYAERAQIEDGHTILDLGCGWGALSLYLAKRYPNSQIVGLSNSQSQRTDILRRAAEEGLNNVTIVTANINIFTGSDDMLAFTQGFDRVVSIEMFEHMKNYRALLAKIADWMKPGGQLFVHIFTHRELAYHYEDQGPDDWMTRYFFTGGTMPSAHLLTYFQDDLRLNAHWVVDGWHYQKTSEAWLNAMDAHKATLLPIIASTYGADQQTKWWVYWRVFFMACAELWGYANGQEWFVSHYRFGKP